jgi:hypothetical protein
MTRGPLGVGLSVDKGPYGTPADAQSLRDLELLDPLGVQGPHLLIERRAPGTAGLLGRVFAC